MSSTSATSWISDLIPTSSPLQGTDAIRTFTQILAVQSLHYFVLSILVPPFLSVLSSRPNALSFEGGALSVSMIFDWREFSGRPTWDWNPSQESYENLIPSDKSLAQTWIPGSVWLGDQALMRQNQDPETSKIISNPIVIPPQNILRPLSKGDDRVIPLNLSETLQVGDVGDSKEENGLKSWEWNMSQDPARKWAIALAWMVAGVADTFLLFHIVRRPTHILDHTITLHLINLILTSWYSSSLPTSLFWWIVIATHAALCIISAERISIQREMKQGLGNTRTTNSISENGSGNGRNVNSRRASVQTPHVLFDEEDEDDDADGKIMKDKSKGLGKVENHEMKPLK